tara:strand:- start:3137 stop:4207 length:1071 start_codon:yes stop_codon:yes gene_type:complete
MTIRENLDALATAIESLEARPTSAKPDILDRELSGNKINGGRITNFSSVGIKDEAKDFVLNISDNGINVDVIKTKVLDNNITVQGDLTITGGITATKLHVDEITADVRNERTSPLEFQGGHGKGLIWTGEGHTRQFTFQPNPDKLFSSENIDLNKDKSYMIEGIPVIQFTKLGDSVTASRLTSVGTLQNLHTEGSLSVDEYVHYDANTERLGVGTSEPNGQLAIKSLDHEFVIDPTEDGEFKIGTWSTTGLDIITDDTIRIKVGQTGGITLEDKVIINGKLGIGVKNFGNVDLAVAGPIKVQGHTVQWLDSVPTSGNYIKGDIIYNASPQPSGYVGWICVRSGSPGEWNPFGLISR